MPEVTCYMSCATCSPVIQFALIINVSSEHPWTMCCKFIHILLSSVSSNFRLTAFAGEQVNGRNSMFSAASLLFRRQRTALVLYFWLAPLSLCLTVVVWVLIWVLVVWRLIIAFRSWLVSFVPGRQPQSPIMPSRQPHRQVVPSRRPQIQDLPSRQPQARAIPALLSSAPDAQQLFSNPQGTDETLTAALLASCQEFIEQQRAILAAIRRQRETRAMSRSLGVVSSCQETIAQQTAILAAIQRQRESPLVSPRLGTCETGGSTAGPSTSALPAASAVPLSVPSADRNSSNRFAVPTEHTTVFADLCVICMTADKDWLCFPCGHLAMCRACSAGVQRQTGRCPICRQPITQVVQVYRA